MKSSMLMSQKAKLKALLMSTSKKVVHTEVARVLALNLLINAPDLKTDLDMVEDTIGIEAMMTVEGTDEVEVVAVLTSDLEAGLITGMEEEEVDIVEDEEEDTMTEGIIVVVAEVLSLNLDFVHAILIKAYSQFGFHFREHDLSESIN